MLLYREAHLGDIEELIPLMINFIKESEYRGLPIEVEAIHDTLFNFIIEDFDKTFCQVAIVEDKIVGCIIGTSSKLPFNSLKQSSETIWYVLSEYRDTKIGMNLYGSFTHWAERNNSVIIHTASPYGSKLDSLYEKNGYQLFEKLYIKVIQ